jgi:tetratricopeptide (TPR) repeat protein
MPIPNSPTKSSEAEVHKGILRRKTKISIAVGIATVISAVLVLALFNQQMLTNEKYALYDKADALNKTGNYTGAITYFVKALAIDPKFKEALNAVQMLSDKKGTLYDKGSALLNRDNYTGAITYFDKALAIDPKFKEALNGEGYASASEPNNKHILNNKGWALNGLGNYAEAIKSIDEALNIDRTYTLALINKGWSLYGLGNCTGAIAYFGKASKTDPKFELTLKQLTQEFILPHCAQTALHTTLLP